MHLGIKRSAPCVSPLCSWHGWHHRSESLPPFMAAVHSSSPTRSISRKDGERAPGAAAPPLQGGAALLQDQCRQGISQAPPCSATAVAPCHGGQDGLQDEELGRATTEAVSLRSPVASRARRVFVCLFFNLIFLYIYFTTELNVWPST